MRRELVKDPSAFELLIKCNLFCVSIHVLVYVSTLEKQSRGWVLRRLVVKDIVVKLTNIHFDSLHQDGNRVLVEIIVFEKRQLTRTDMDFH